MASIVEQIIAQVFGDPSLTAVTKAVGRRETETNAGPNRIVAVPLGAPVIRQPDRPGDPKDPARGRILLVREFSIEWHCHGANSEGAVDFTAAEDLYLLTLIAVRQALHNSVRFGDERWEDQQEGADSFERFGTVIKFTSEVHIPVYESRPVSGRITTLTATPQIVTTLTEGTESITINQGTP